MQNKFVIGLAAVLVMSSMGLQSCKKKSSTNSKTGWAYNDPTYGGFEKAEFRGQKTLPGMVLIQGGTFIMGQTEEDLLYENDAFPRPVTVNSFYMDETEITNIDWRQYVYWMTNIYQEAYPEVVRAAKPDTQVWRSPLSFNEPLVKYYYRYPAYDDYPVVGVSWEQCMQYCTWRTDRRNEATLIEEGFIEANVAEQIEDDHFNTEAYLLKKYEVSPKEGGQLTDFNPNGEGERGVRFADGIFTTDFRLPTEAEWEYAAKSNVGNHVDPTSQEVISNRKIYPWNGITLREKRHGGWHGKMLANFKRGHGDYGGLAPNLNDGSIGPATVYSYMPNAYGLFNMAGNVNEWVMDVYRKFTSADANDLNPFRGSVYREKVLDEEFIPVDKDSLGRIQYQDQQSNLENKRNYTQAQNIDFGDGSDTTEQGRIEYAYGDATLVSNSTRVYKGGSWNDEAYWLSPGTRRYLEETQSTATIGFRCVQHRVGGDQGNEAPEGMQFKETSRQKSMNKKNRK